MVEKKITATSPCMKFVDCSLWEQLDKLNEEVKEVRQEIITLEGLYQFRATNEVFVPTKKSINRVIVRLMVEMLDVQTCINTMFEQLKKQEPKTYNENREAAEAKVIEKNMTRGYYAEEVRK